MSKMNTLVTFLGRPRKSKDGGYDEATYRFPDGVDRKSAYFGLALAEHLSPDRVVLLGTPGSMWGVLVESLATEGDEEDARLTLLEAEEREAVTEDLLVRLAPGQTSLSTKNCLETAVNCALSWRTISVYC